MTEKFFIHGYDQQLNFYTLSDLSIIQNFKAPTRPTWINANQHNHFSIIYENRICYIHPLDGPKSNI